MRQAVPDVSRRPSRTSHGAADAVARAVLYEGFVLYPYRSSSLKNRHRWLFGSIGPRGGGEANAMRVECLLRGGNDPVVQVAIRFLHPLRVERELANGEVERELASGEVERELASGEVERELASGEVERELASGEVERDAPTMADAIERDVTLDSLEVVDLCRRADERTFSFGRQTVRSEDQTLLVAERVEGKVETSASALGDGVYQIRVDLQNTTSCPPATDGVLVSLAAAHVRLIAVGGEFCSLADPPEDLAEHAARCKNVGAWPALLTRHAVLASAIVLPDFPAIAGASPGDLFDATEIDEILTLRILALTDAEKEEVRRDGGRARALLERTESLGADDLARLHGAVRVRPAHRLRPGDRVRIVPHRRADVLDLALADRCATVVSVEEDFEGAAYVAVTVDDDPGADLGRAGQPGHRFFFHPDEVEPCT